MNMVMKTNSMNMLSLSGCTCETYFPDRNSFVRIPGLLTKSHSVLRNFGSHIKALYRYSMTNPQTLRLVSAAF